LITRFYLFHVPKNNYRSIHYILETKPASQPIYGELQVRTLFEEVWSEIDHTIRYPNKTDNKELKFILDIFNRLTGMADEVAMFINELDKYIEKAQETNIQRINEVQELTASYDQILAQLEQTDKKNKQMQESIEFLKKQRHALEQELTQLQIKPTQFDLGRRAINSLNLNSHSPSPSPSISVSPQSGSNTLNTFLNSSSNPPFPSISVSPQSGSNTLNTFLNSSSNPPFPPISVSPQSGSNTLNTFLNSSPNPPFPPISVSPLSGSSTLNTFLNSSSNPPFPFISAAPISPLSGSVSVNSPLNLNSNPLFPTDSRLFLDTICRQCNYQYQSNLVHCPKCGKTRTP
jgi:hypothetical protein